MWNERFGELRSLLQNPWNASRWATRVWELLVWAHAEDASAYHAQWRPYLEGHDLWGPRPLHTCTSLGALERAIALAPFARFGFIPEDIRDDLDAIADTPLFSHVLHLAWSAGGLTDARLERLAHNPHLQHLERLILHGRFEDQGVLAIVTSPHLGALSSLHLADNELEAPCGEALASMTLPNLQTLNLSNNWLEREGVAALAQGPQMSRLRSLDLEDNFRGEEGARSLAASPRLHHLTDLNLGSNELGVWGTRAITHSPHLHRLRRLHLPDNQLGNEGAALLADAPQLAGLTMLDLRRNGITETGAQAIRTSPHLRETEILW